MYPGSGLQTEIECSDSGPPLSYNFETVQIGSADALFKEYSLYIADALFLLSLSVPWNQFQLKVLMLFLEYSYQFLADALFTDFNGTMV